MGGVISLLGGDFPELAAPKNSPVHIVPSSNHEAACKQTCVKIETEIPFEDDYALTATILGHGMNGPVRVAECKRTGKQVAVKFLSKKSAAADKDTLKLFRQEACVYLGLDHPNIAKLCSVYESPERLSLVMEKCTGGELHCWVQEVYRHTFLGEETVAMIAQQMCSALAYLHSHHVVHRDTKLENFLIERRHDTISKCIEDARTGSSLRIKLIDFGLARYWHPTDCTMTRQCGSLSHIAPELLRGEGYTNSVDMWALGTCVYILFCGVPPFFAPTKDALTRKILEGKYATMTGSRWNKVSSAAKNFVERLICVNPEARMTAQQALSHTFLTQQRARMPRPFTYQSLPVLATSSGPSSSLPSNEDLTKNFGGLEHTTDEVDVSPQGLALSAFHNFVSATPQDRAIRRLFASFLTTNEIEQDIINLFQDFDVDHDGTIRHADFIQAARLYFPVMTDNDIEKLFHALQSSSETLSRMEKMSIRCTEKTLKPRGGMFHSISAPSLQCALTTTSSCSSLVSTEKEQVEWKNRTGAPQPPQLPLRRCSQESSSFEKSMRPPNSDKLEISFSDFVAIFVPYIIKRLDSPSSVTTPNTNGDSCRLLSRQVFDRLFGRDMTFVPTPEQKEAMQQFQRYDLNADGRVDFDEFLQYIRQEFA